MLTHEEAHDWIGHDVGGVCPFALPEDVKAVSYTHLSERVSWDGLLFELSNLLDILAIA